MAELMQRPSMAQEFREQLERREQQFAKALPPHMDAGTFLRVAITAINLNPKLLEADRTSLFNELMRCAQDGLKPDGREAVLVIYQNKVRYQQMVLGMRKLVQQSGEITRFEQTVVYSNDKFAYHLGDHPEIRHEPAIEDRGIPILVYSIAQFNDGTLSREVMTAAEIQKVRQSSRARDDGPWVNWWDEMARKTAAKRHAKVLPMSSDARDALKNDDDETDFRPQPLPPWPSERRPSLTDREMDNGPTPQPDDQGGRQPVIGKAPADKEEYEAQLKADLDRAPVDQGDFAIGRNDAEHGRTACLNKDIKDDPQRMADWQRGFDSYQPKRKR